MQTLPKLEIHGETPDGKKYILNHFDADNGAVRAAANPHDAFTKLQEKCALAVMRWQAYLPHDKIYVARV